jgi:hypothetical protein
MIIPDLAHTRAGDAVTSIEDHKGMLRGTVVIGTRPDGQPVVTNRYWYPDGRMTPLGATEHDLDLER